MKNAGIACFCVFDDMFTNMSESVERFWRCCLPGKEVSRGTLSVTIGEGSVIGKRVCQMSRKKTVKIEKGLETKHFPKNIDTLA